MNESLEHDRKRFSLSAFGAAFLSVVLTVSLVLFSAFPRLGIQPFDEVLHPQKAVAIAGVDDVVMITAFITLAAVSGVYFTGTTNADVRLNASKAFEDFCSSASAAGYDARASLSAAISDGRINIGALNGGLFGYYLNWLINYTSNISSASGSNSADVGVSGNVFTFNGSSIPVFLETSPGRMGYGYSDYGVWCLKPGSTTYIYGFNRGSSTESFPLYHIDGSSDFYCTTNHYMDGSNLISCDVSPTVVNGVNYYSLNSIVDKISPDGKLHVLNSWNVSFYNVNSDGSSTKVGTYSSTGDICADVDTSGISSVVAPDALIHDPSATLPDESVDLFNPSDAQAAQGYSSADITNATLNDISITADGVLDFLQKAWQHVCDWVINLGRDMFRVGNSIISGVNAGLDTLASAISAALAAGVTSLSGILSAIQDWVKTLSGTLTDVWSAVLSIPDIITTWFKNFFFPNPDHFTDAVQQVKQAGITKLGIDSNSWGLNVGSRIPEGLSASLYLGILDTNDYVLFDPKFLIDGVNTFRYVIQAFIGFLMFLFCYNNIVSMMGGRPISIIGHTITESGGKSGGRE